MAAFAACAVAQYAVPIAGTRDLTGGYYDHYSGQYSSALTGRVYNTAPAVVAGKFTVLLDTFPNYDFDSIQLTLNFATLYFKLCSSSIGSSPRHRRPSNCCRSSCLDQKIIS